MNKHPYMVALGASAGGLEPLESFFESVPPDTDITFVVVQHLAPDHKSLMDELLARYTSMPIEIIQEGTIPRRGTIYLNPPRKTVLLRDNTFCLVDKTDRKLSFPISSFFSSLAENHKEYSCAIILSGTGSDGTNGIKEIKEQGGLVLVQDPQEAKFNGMPNSAIATGVVDKICPVNAMINEITLFFDSLTSLGRVVEGDTNQENELKKIVHMIQELTNIDFSGYKLSTIHRRVRRRLSSLGHHNMSDYLADLSGNPTEAQHMAQELLIGVTRFFRDEEAFMELREKAIPRLIAQSKESKRIRIWVPACSSGEEAYSVAILVKDCLKKQRLDYEVSIFATDLNADAIKLAANRVFPESIANDVPPEYLGNYFQAKQNGFVVSKEIREMVVFSVHNVVQHPPFNKIDMVSCRNFLIYITDTLQQHVFALFQYALRKDGILFLGTSESLGKSQDEFEELSKRHKIYVNKENKPFVPRSSASVPLRKDVGTALPRNSNLSTERLSPANSKRTIQEIQHLMIQEFAPDTLIVDADFNVLHSSGNAHRWLTVPVGEISANLFKMLPDGVKLPLEVVARQVLQKGKPMELAPVEVPENIRPFMQGAERIRILIKRKLMLDDSPILLIMFEIKERDAPLTQYETLDITTASKERIQILERELRINQESLQTTIEELESSNEELQSANEELQSSNEELESVNEELYTVNAEYQEKNLELSRAKDDLENLIHSTDVAMLFLDSELNIRRFTPAIKHILELLPHDIGRNISHFRGKIQLENFLAHIEEVIQEGIPFESRIEDIKGRKYLLKISPFQSKSKEPQGVVLVLVELTNILAEKKALELSERSLLDLRDHHKDQTELLGLISENLRDMICVLNEKGQIEYSTSSASEILELPLDKVYEANFLHFIVGKKEKANIAQIISANPDKVKSGLVSFRIKKPDGKKRWVEASFKTLTSKDSGTTRSLVTIRDVHHKKLNEIALQKMSLIAEQTNSAVIITDKKGRITYTNGAFEKMTGFSERDALGKTPGSLLQGEESDPETVKEMSKAIKAKKGFHVNIINYDKAGHKYVVNVKAEPLYDREDNFLGFFSIQNDITREQEYLDQVHRLNQTIKDQNTKLKEINNSLEDFAYIASHDLKAPVRNIKGMLELIERKGEDLGEERRRRYFEIIKEASDEMNRMIDSLLEYSRSGTVREEKAVIDLEETFRNIKRTFHLELERIGGHLDFEIEVDSIEVYPTLFNRLMTNLIGNAIKYRSDRLLKIKVTARKKGELITFAVADNGMGIEEKHFDEIFKIFKVIAPNKDSTGIGLSVCKKIVELHGGNILLESTPGIGTTFYVELPNK
ncbi:MAG: PAS domain-containing protein [Muricauda sp.]|nr:CheR family methyltransferase [Allomuricauda sp.]MBO6532170.1 PAS domain-containing protein [Allomuricauda sp.]MBO6588531.1 PAS domain-containing protein [Allomuricauda sp.]MBO6618329.1 PAS domain-containing protein [Allomuricauda sp.]MBO6644069.1 PAS domain-containing protein [Allomuricauda sp.]MBO6746953.1 PAS domain-containing protein [Allomuricauda sp.]